MGFTLGQSSYTRYDFYYNDEKYLMCKYFSETTPRRGNRAVYLLTVAMMHLDLPNQLPQPPEHMNPNPYTFHFDLIEIRHELWIEHVTEWWQQQEETQLQYADHYNVAHKIFGII
jgi:hypothetical protein